MTTKRELLSTLAHRSAPQQSSSPASIRPKRTNWQIAGALAIAAATCAAGYMHTSRSAGPIVNTGTAAPAANPDVAAPSANASRLEVSGFVTATRTATVSARTVGVLQSIRVDEGDHVDKNQVIAHLDDTHARIDFEQAQANAKLAATRVHQAEVELAEAQRVLDRERALVSANFASAAALTRSQTDLQLRQVALESARQERDLAQIEVQRNQALLNDYTIRAPFAGVVLERNAQEGETIAPSSAGGGFTRTGICTIADMDSREIAVDISEDMVDRVRPKQRIAAMASSNGGKPIDGEVLKLEPTADRAKATVRARIRIDQPPASLLPGMSVKVTFL